MFGINDNNDREQSKKSLLLRPAVQIKEIEAILRLAIKNLFQYQPDINDFSSETGQTEWNLAHHLANEISKILPDYSCDLDVTKKNLHNRRPDIIFHKRGNNEHNFLVIEMKRNGSDTEIDDDIRKINEDWFSEPLCYSFGAVINLKGPINSLIKVFKNHGHRGFTR